MQDNKQKLYDIEITKDYDEEDGWAYSYSSGVYLTSLPLKDLKEIVDKEVANPPSRGRWTIWHSSGGPSIINTTDINELKDQVEKRARGVVVEKDNSTGSKSVVFPAPEDEKQETCFVKIESAEKCGNNPANISLSEDSPGVLTNPSYLCIPTADGMTLRDYFAAQALAGIMARGPVLRLSEVELVTKEAYAIADAMISARDA